MKQKKRWYMPIVDTATHVFVASALFCIVALPALALSLLVHWMEKEGMPSYTMFLLTGLEFAIVTIDVIGVLLYIVTKLYEQVRGDDDDDENEGNQHGT